MRETSVEFRILKLGAQRPETTSKAQARNWPEIIPNLKTLQPEPLNPKALNPQPQPELPRQQTESLRLTQSPLRACWVQPSLAPAISKFTKRWWGLGLRGQVKGVGIQDTLGYVVCHFCLQFLVL